MERHVLAWFIQCETASKERSISEVSTSVNNQVQWILAINGCTYDFTFWGLQSIPWELEQVRGVILIWMQDCNHNNIYYGIPIRS